MKLIICSKCGIQSSNISWVKRMVFVMDFAPDYFIREPIEDYEKDMKDTLDHCRQEFLSIVKEDLENENHAGESFYCNDCFKEF